MDTTTAPVTFGADLGAFGFELGALGFRPDADALRYWDGLNVTDLGHVRVITDEDETTGRVVVFAATATGGHNEVQRYAVQLDANMPLTAATGVVRAVLTAEGLLGGAA